MLVILGFLRYMSCVECVDIIVRAEMLHQFVTKSLLRIGGLHQQKEISTAHSKVYPGSVSNATVFLMCLETIYASKWIVLPPVFTQTSCSHLSHLEIFCRNTECNLKCYVHVLVYK
ncbi:hypothetical protein GQX74_008785 [Glossina fuscipes]|nr:hypothetical protein GQX74_008785 [Glossina fuscipes]